MSKIIELRLESGEVVLIEDPDASEPELKPMGMGAEVAKEAGASFEAALENVKPAARAVVNAFRELNEPDEIGVEFGIQFKSKANVFVLTGEANASFKLSLKWKSDRS